MLVATFFIYINMLLCVSCLNFCEKVETIVIYLQLREITGRFICFYLILYSSFLTQLTLSRLKRLVTLCTFFCMTTVYIQLSAQNSIPAGKVAPVQKSRYISPASGTLKSDTILAASDTAASGRQVLPYTRQVGKPGYSSFVLAPLAPPSLSGNNTGRRVKPSDISIHGNILYSVDYRSYIDTPYAEKEVYYHTVQTYYDVVYKNRYPVRVYLTNRFSNSAFTRRFTDLSMNFNANDYKNRIKQVISRYPAPSLLSDSLNMLDKKLGDKRLENLQLNSWVNSAATLQRLVEIKERELYQQQAPAFNPDTLWDMSALAMPDVQKPHMPGAKELPGYLQKTTKQPSDIAPKQPAPPSKADDSAFLADYRARKQKIDSLQQELRSLEKKYYACKQQVAAWQQQKNRSIDQASTTQELEAEIRSRNIPDSALPEGYQSLWAIKSFGIGRTVVDYSELSAKNVSINGVQLEYNPSYYVAVAAGTIDYRFRDFIVKNATAPAQHLYLVRVGRGQKNGNNIILTWYTGKKQLYNSTGSTQSIQPDYHLMGFTLEGNYKLNRTTYVTAEVAKSSLPYYNQPGMQKNLLAATVRFSEHSNEAYSLKIQSEIKASGTRINVFYKRYGASFQSFSLITTGVEQKAWMVKADQPLFRRRLMLTASLKENDYSNPAANTSYQSNIVFKSAQATLRIPRWPVVMVGYYPSAQLTKLSNGEYTENMFYSLVGNMSYYYKMNQVNMSSTAMYTRFYNKQSDSAFIYSNTTNLLFNQVLFYNRLTCQLTGAVSLSHDYNLYTLDQEVQYAVLQWLKAGAGMKYNRQTGYNITQLGYKGTVAVSIKKLGELQLMMDKGFIPGANKQLVENKTGRFSFFRTF